MRSRRLRRGAGAVAAIAAFSAFGCGNGEPAATPEPTPVTTPAPAPTPQTYVVQPGDNLTRIAEQFNTTVDALVQANNIQDPNRIHPGQELNIPPP